MKLIKRILSEEFSFLLACPAVMWQLFFLYLPLMILCAYSFFEYPSFTLVHYKQTFSAMYLKVVLRSFYIALTTSFFCFLIAYPVAYFLAMKVPKRFKSILLFSLILPQEFQGS